MTAYACGPDGTGEHWLGWGWAREASRLGHVHLITTPKYQDSVSIHAKELGITCDFIAPEGPDGWGRKLSWQRRVYRQARERHLQDPFHLAHQTTFHTFRVPFLCAQLGVPSVWGPIAGGESVPQKFYGVLGKAQWGERLRSWINRLCLRLPSVRQSLSLATRIFVSNHTTLQFLPARVHPKCRIVPPNAWDGLIPLGKIQPRAHGPQQPLQLLYVGNCVGTRALPLIFSALKMVSSGTAHLKIVGDGPSLPAWKEEVAGLGLSGVVEFLGPQPKESLGRFYGAADLFVFPALRDSGGSALLEAMGRGLSVLCFPWGGPGEMVDQQSGILIPLEDPHRTARAIAAAMEKHRRHPEWAQSLAQKAQERVRDRFFWKRKAQILSDTYLEILPSP
jgi:glycosyltransferase involved in cell wall biosynthesis